MAFGKMGARGGFGSLGGLGSAGGLSPRSYQYPYPTFPSTVISRFRAASDFSASSAHPVDTASPGNPYGNPTAPQFNFPSGGWTILQQALTSAGPIDTTGFGSVRVTFMPTNNSASFNMSQFNIKLFSTTNPLSPGSNSTQASASSRVGLQWSGTGANGGCWQSITVPMAAFTTINGTGADMTSIRHVQIGGFGACGFQLGDVEFVPNPRTKGAVIIRADDSALNQYTDLFPLMTAWGAQGVLMPSPLFTTIDKNNSFFMTSAQLKEMLDAGWHGAAQGGTTEDINTIDAWTSAQRRAEWGAIPPFYRGLGWEIGSYHGSYMSNFGMKDNIARQDFRNSFQSACNFTGGQVSGTPIAISETFPFGDPYNITCLNMNTWGDVTDIYESHLLAQLDLTRACRGVLIIAGHNEWNLANFKSALNKVGDYVVNQFPTTMEFTTIRKILAPYNGDPLIG